MEGVTVRLACTPTQTSLQNNKLDGRNRLRYCSVTQTVFRHEKHQPKSWLRNFALDCSSRAHSSKVSPRVRLQTGWGFYHPPSKCPCFPRLSPTVVFPSWGRVSSARATTRSKLSSSSSTFDWRAYHRHRYQSMHVSMVG